MRQGFGHVMTSALADETLLGEEPPLLRLWRSKGLCWLLRLGALQVCATRESSSSSLSLLLTRIFYVCLILTLSDHTHMHSCPHMPTHTQTHTHSEVQGHPVLLTPGQALEDTFQVPSGVILSLAMKKGGQVCVYVPQESHGHIPGFC